jgi:tetratricopeptide (TPR) repeat protein
MHIISLARVVEEMYIHFLSLGLRFLSLSILLCALAPAVRSQQRPPDTGHHTNQAVVTKAQSLIGSGQLDAAVEMLSTAARNYPRDLEISYLLGLAYYRKGDSPRAVEYTTRAVKGMPQGSPSYRQAVQMLALSHYVLGQIREALPYLEQLSGWMPDNVETTYALGVCYIQTHNPGKSREVFARMFSVTAGSASAYLINAQMMVRQQFEESAEKELEKALELDPRLPQANFLLGEMAIYHAQVDHGIELLQKEIAINPTFGMAYYRLGEAYTRQLKWDEAIAPLQKSIWLNPYFSGPYIVLGKVYLKKTDLRNAESMLRRALQMDPNNYSGHHLLAQVLQQANRSDEAKKEFEIAERLRANADQPK